MKKLLLSLVALLFTVGTWAQNVVTDINPEKVYTLECRSGYAHSSTRFIGDNGTIINGQAAEGTYFSFVQADGGYYIKSVVSGKYLNYEPRYNNDVLQNQSYINAEDEPKSVWKINSNPNNIHNGLVYFTVANDQYLNNNGTQTQTTGGCTNLQANKHAGGPGASNACSLWQLKEYDASVATAKGLLEALIREASAIQWGTNICDYTQASVETLALAIEGAQEKVDANNVTDADVVELQAAIDALEIVLPDSEKFYVLRCNHENRYVYVNTSNLMQWTGTTPTEYASNYVWQYEAGVAKNTVKMKSVHTQSYLNTVVNNQQVSFGQGADVTILKKASVSGAYVFEAGNAGIGLHAHGSNNRVIGYTNDAGANSYFFIEVTNFAHTLNVGESGWATLVLGFNAEIPDGVNVFAVSQINETSATLEPVKEILPANEAVLVNAPQGSYSFAYTSESAEALPANELMGTLYTTNVTPEDGTTCYVLSNPAEGLGFYMAQLTDGHFQNNANKVYLPVANSTSQVLKFNFGTTGIEGVESNANTAKSVIYDLSGRRVNATTKGIYIQNGKKFIVK
jgi:hypothetical protein